MQQIRTVLIVLIGVVFLAACQNQSATNPTPTPTPTATPTPQGNTTNQPTPEDWNEVTDPVLGVSFSYPQDWNLELTDSLMGETSVTSFDPSRAQPGNVPSNELKIAIVRFDTDHQNNRYTAPSESEILEQRQITVGGNAATWRRLQGIGESISIEVRREDFIYLISAYPADSEYLQTYNQVVDSIQFTPGLDLVSPTPNQRVTSPLTVEGSIPGTWFFEASFTAHILDGNRQNIGTGVMQADGEWMTEEAVSFSGEIEFTPPSNQQNGYLVLEKSNPSGLPENARSVFVPIRF